jgi:tryptophan synthase alpha chain
VFTFLRARFKRKQAKIPYDSTMERIQQAFARARKTGRACFIPYIWACDPDLETLVSICLELVGAGVDVLEIGVPFSDPLADGLTNQLAAQRALEAGATHDGVFELVRRVREAGKNVPVILYTYYNLVFSQGIAEYVRRAKEAGVDGLLTLDLPPEEAGDLVEACRDAGLANIFIIAPTTPDERIPLIAGSGTGFLYYVSREGVTGARDEVAAGFSAAVGRIKARTDLPVVVGFGISTPGHVREVAKFADGVVVGSAIVNCIPENMDSRGAIPGVIGTKARELMAGLA